MEPRGLRWTSSLSLIAAEYRDYETPNGEFDGNDEPGILDWQLYEEIAYRQRSGGSRVHASQPTLGLCVRSRNLLAGTVLGVQNLLDQDYAARVRLNAQNARYFEPGAGLSVYGGISITACL